MARIRYSFSSRHTGKIKNIAKQKEKYPSIMKSVIDISDIILEVLDARFIPETRNKEIESYIKEKGKKIIYVLNKSDLVDQKETKLPKNLRPFVFVSATKGTGANALRNKIKIEAKKIDIGEKKRVHVGIIGYPNSGKSSLINLLTRRSAAKTSKQAGYTKGMQKIRLTDTIQIIDTPGVIEESKYSSSNTKAVKKDARVGARTYSDVKNPEDVVHFLMQEYENVLENHYNILVKGNSDLLIERLGHQKNFLQKGGQIDSDRTARLILKEWQEGKIKIK